MLNPTLRGPVVLKYVHLCQRASSDLGFVTWERVRRRIRIPDGELGQFPEGSTLALRLEERGGVEGPRDLTVVLFKEGPEEPGIGHTIQVQFDLLEVGMPLVCRHHLEVPPLALQGPGIYYFDLLIGNQFLGRLPIMVFTDSGTPSETISRGPLRGNFVSLEFGHLAESVTGPVDNDPEEAQTFTRVMEAFLIPEGTGPFSITPSTLVFGLSAPEGSPATRRVTVQPRDGEGNALVPPVEQEITMLPWMPGELFWNQQLLLSENLAYGGPGDYDFLISVDGKPVGTVDLPVREVPGTSESSG